MPDDLEYRIGASPRITHTVRAGSTPQSVTATVYDADGDQAASITGTAALGDADDLFDVSFVFPTVALSAGDYTYTIAYTVGSEIAVMRGEISLLPAVSKFDRWVRRISDWLLETGTSHERQLSWRQLRDAALQAVVEYSRANPRHLSTDVTLTDAYEYTLPTDWENGFSQIERLDYPLDDDDVWKLRPEPGEWEVDEARGKWRFTMWTPSTAEVARLYYSAPHVVQDAAGDLAASDTVPAKDFAAVCQYAAGLALLQLSARAPRVNAPDVRADRVNSRTKEQEYGARAQAMMDAAKEAWPYQASLSVGDLWM